MTTTLDTPATEPRAGHASRWTPCGRPRSSGAPLYLITFASSIPAVFLLRPC